LVFDRLFGRFQLKVKDRESAGNILGETLKGDSKKGR
jgi:hypothetical protein